MQGAMQELVTLLAARLDEDLETSVRVLEQAAARLEGTVSVSRFQSLSQRVATGVACEPACGVQKSDRTLWGAGCGASAYRDGSGGMVVPGFVSMALADPSC
jgi:hypothetical protein